MNFYARQAEARQQTRRLVLLFIVAVLAVGAAVNFVVLTVLASLEGRGLVFPNGTWLAAHPGSIVITSLVVLAIIGFASLYKSMALRAGGGVVAHDLGATRIDRTQQDPLRRRLFNVVEEMAIASGVPMPEVYVLDHEAGINAFAAGHSPANAAVAVTRGALEKLNRSELQGVIAHEFSHVLNGDMRLNTRLIGILFGLMVLVMIARTVMRHAPRSSGRSKGGAGFIVLAALAVMIVGYIGVFFGRIVQAAVSRQRERLADASAVQFTREPQGLKGALVKIGAHEHGSRLADARTEEVAHMLFASGLSRAFSTHPPLEERIRALDPGFDPREFARVRFEDQTAASGAAKDERTRGAAAAGAAGGATAGAAGGVAAGLTSGLAPQAERVADLVGNPGTRDVEAAQFVASALPAGVMGALDAPGRGLATLLALVLDPKEELRTRQLVVVRERLGEPVVGSISAVQEELAALDPAHRLPLLSEVFPALRRLPREDRQRVFETLGRVVLIDGRIEIFEYALATLARLWLRDELDPSAERVGSMTLDKASVELQTVFSTLAQHGSGDETAARRAYELGMHHVLPSHRPPYQPVAGWPRAMDRALICLDRLQPAAKEMLIAALVKTISHDGRITVAEAELLRAICAALHCPLPLRMGESARGE